MAALLQQYKAFVKKHPSLVVNAERLLHWLVWNPERFSGSEYAYESFNAAVGLLGIYNDSILSEHPGQQQDAANWAFWLAAVEQVQTLIELRAIHLEQRGKTSRYGPLIALEVLKCSLRLALWRSSKCTLAIEEVSREDQEQHECQDQLKELLEALLRLRQRYDSPATAATPEHMQYNAHLAHASAVRAAAVAPHRPPAACAAADAVLPGTAAALQQQQQQQLAASRGVRCAVCGAVQDSKGSSSSCNNLATDQQALQQLQQQSCKVCGRLLQGKSSALSAGSSSSSKDGGHPLPGLTEISPDDSQPTGAGQPAVQATSSGASPLQRGWWARMTDAVGMTTTPSQQQQQQRRADVSTSKAQQQKLQQQQQHAAVTAPGFAGALPGSWGPGLRPYPALTPTHSKAEQLWQQQHQPPPWSLSHRDASIGRSVMWAGEFVHVVRPLVYVVMLKQYGLTSWKPWLTMLALDAASGYGLHTGHAILMRSNASKWPAGSTLFSLALLRSLSSGQWSPGEQQELLARRVQLLRYLLRSPCYTAFTRHLLLKAVAGSRWVPGLSSLADFAFSMIEGMQSYYTYVES